MSIPEALPEVVEETRAKQVAALSVAGLSQDDMSKELGISKRQVRKILVTDEFKAAVKEIGDEAVRVAVQIIRTRTARLADKATVQLEKALNKGDLEAVKLVYKTAGIFDSIEKQPAGDTNLTVVLPGASKEVKADVVEGEFRIIDSQVQND